MAAWRAPPSLASWRGPASTSWSWSARPSWRWRAGGVFASPATVAAARRLGVDGALLARVTRPIPAMRVETPGGAAFDLTLRDGDRRTRRRGHGPVRAGPRPPRGGRRGGRPAADRGGGHRSRPAAGGRLGRDRPRRARRWRAHPGRPGSGRGSWSAPTGPARSWRGRPAWTVPAACRRRIGLSYHLADPRPEAARRERGCGSSTTATSGSPPFRAAGSTSGSCWVRAGDARLAGDGAAAVADRVLRSVPSTADDPHPVARRPPVRPDRRRGPARTSGDTPGGSGLAGGRRCRRLPRSADGRGAAPRVRVRGARSRRDRQRR